MKCINCNNEINENMEVCPFCANPVVKVNPLPVTPSEPILPQDQEMTPPMEVLPAATLEQTGAIETLNPNEINGVNNNQAQVMQTPQMQQPQVMQTPQVQQPQVMQQPQVQVPSEQPIAPAPQSVVPKPIEVQSPMQMGPDLNKEKVVLQNNINPEFINPNGETVSGEKIGSTTIANPKKKKIKLIIWLILFSIFLLLCAISSIYYFTQYKSAEKRLTTIFNTLTKATNNIKNDNIDKSSGTYDISLNVNYNDNQIKSHIKGDYAKDLSNNALDLNVILEELTMGEELINKPVNLEFYYNDAKFYVLLKDWYDKYIYQETEEIAEYLDTIEQNNINYTSIINSLKKATSKAIVSMNNTQDVKDINIHGTKTTANVINIKLTTQNIKLFYKTFLRTLSNDQNFIKEYATIYELEEDKVKKKLTDAIEEDIDIKGNDAVIEIATGVFNKEFIGIKITSKDEDNNVFVFEFYPVKTGYGISLKEGSQNVFEGSYISTKKTTSTTKEGVHEIDFTFYDEEVAYTIDLDISLIEDVNPKDAKVNVRNSINKVYLTDEIKEDILTKFKSSGNIALYTEDILKLYIGYTQIDQTYLTPSSADPNKCLIVGGCEESNYDGYSICINNEYEEVICDNTWINEE